MVRWAYYAQDRACDHFHCSRAGTIKNKIKPFGLGLDGTIKFFHFVSSRPVLTMERTNQTLEKDQIKLEREREKGGERGERKLGFEYCGASRPTLNYNPQ